MAEFQILDHLDKLEPDGGANDPRGDHSFFCPVCGAKNFKVNIRTGKWGTYSCDCSSTENGKRKIRDAISPAIASAGAVPSTKPQRPKQFREWPYFTAASLRRDEPAIVVKRWDDPEGKTEDGFKHGRKIRQDFRVGTKEQRPEVIARVQPYRLQDALKELADGAPYVFWPEGEPCCDALWDLGLPAITNLMGSGQFKPERDGPLITKIPPERLVVVPDRDKPGMKHAEAIANEYPGCRWLLPFPGTAEWNGAMPESGGIDIADWIAQGATAQHILNGIGPRPKPEPQTEELLPLSERIDNRIQELLDAHLSNKAGEIDAAFAELYKLGVKHDRAQQRILMLWADQHDLDISTNVAVRQNVKGRVIGQAKEGKGLRQQLPGFGIDKDLHCVVSDAAAGKTTALCELVTVMTARDKGFLDHETPRTDPDDDPRTTALVIASDGEGSAFSMWEDYLNSISGIDRGANVEIWAQDDDTGETAWNVSLHNLERLIKRLAEGDVCVVVMDTANAIFRGAGINTGTGPIETYLRLLKQIVCRHCSLWITQHTNRNSGTTMKAIGGHPAFQEVPSVVHLIEVKEQSDGEKQRIWHVLKLRGSPYRRFSYVLANGELTVTDGHFYQNCREQVLVTLHKQILGGGFTSPGDIIRITGRPQQSVYSAMNELRAAKLIRAKGRGYRLTAAGERVVASLRIASEEPTQEPECPF